MKPASLFLLAALLGSPVVLAQPFTRTPIDGVGADDSFGSAIAAGDLNGDGLHDVLVRSDVGATSMFDDGEVHVFLGAGPFPAPGLDASAAALTFADAATADGFAAEFAAGDLNGDGFDDLVIAAPFEDTRGADAGAVYVFCGGPAPDATPDLVIYGRPTGMIEDEAFNLGEDLAVGDVDGDGADDLIAGGVSLGTGRGEYFVFLGSGALCPAVPGTLNAEVAASFLVSINPGDAAAVQDVATGNVNGDAYDDLLFVDTTEWFVTSESAYAEGAAFVFFGRSSFPATLTVERGGVNEADATYYGFGNPTDEDESRLAFYADIAAGDLNDDGADEVIVAGERLDEVGFLQPVEQRLFMFQGAPTPPSSTLAEDADGVVTFAVPASFAVPGVRGGAGDVTGDGVEDLLAAGSPVADDASRRAFVFLGPLAFPFTLTEAHADFTASGETSNVLEVPVALENVNASACPEFAIGEPGNDTEGLDAGRAFIYTCEEEDTTPPVCGAIIPEFDGPGGALSALTSSASDPESGIASVTFTSLVNLTGFVDGAGPFSQGNVYVTPDPDPSAVSVRGERISYATGGRLVVTVTNGAGLTATCDPVVSQLSAVAPEAFGLMAVYPNPAAAATAIQFALPAAEHVRLVVYDVSGREVARLVDEWLEGGAYEAVWEAAGLASGTYVFELRAGAQRATGRVTLLR